MHHEDVINTISSACRHRHVSHCILSQIAYDIYRSNILATHKRKGLKYATAHGVSLFPIDWLPKDMDEIVVAFRSSEDLGKALLEQVRLEPEDDDDVEIARSALYNLVDKAELVVKMSIGSESK